MKWIGDAAGACSTASTRRRIKGSPGHSDGRAIAGHASQSGMKAIGSWSKASHADLSGTRVGALRAVAPVSASDTPMELRLGGF